MSLNLHVQLVDKVQVFVVPASGFRGDFVFVTLALRFGPQDSGLEIWDRFGIFGLGFRV